MRIEDGMLGVLAGTGDAIQVFAEGEGFSGKRPFGDSGWQSQLEFDMVKAGLLPPDPQNNADFGEMFADVPSFEALIRECIKAL